MFKSSALVGELVPPNNVSYAAIPKVTAAKADEIATPPEPGGDGDVPKAAIAVFDVAGLKNFDRVVVDTACLTANLCAVAEVLRWPPGAPLPSAAAERIPTAAEEVSGRSTSIRGAKAGRCESRCRYKADNIASSTVCWTDQVSCLVRENYSS